MANHWRNTRLGGWRLMVISRCLALTRRWVAADLLGKVSMCGIHPSTQNAGAPPGGTKASGADKEEGGSKAKGATRTAGTGTQNIGDGRACAWGAATTQGMAWPASRVATGCQGNPCSSGIRWGVSPAAQMGCLRNRRRSPSGADQPRGGKGHVVDGRDNAWRSRAPGPHAHGNAVRQVMDGLRTDVCGQQKQSPATTSTTSMRQLLGAADTQTAHPATSSTAPAHQPLGSANAGTTPAGAPAAAADRKQRSDATCEGKNGGLSRAP